MIKVPHAARLLILPTTIAMLAACTTPSQDAPLKSTSDVVVAQAKGVPGGIARATEEIVATIVSINPSKRTFVVKDDAGNQRTVQAPPEMTNFSQLAVGDRVRAAVAVETIVYVQEPGKPLPDDMAGMAGTAPAGAKPAMAVVEQARITAKVIAIDTTQRTATLQFEDGSKHVVAVRPDVEVSKKYLGQNVVIIITAAVAAAVEKQ